MLPEGATVPELLEPYTSALEECLAVIFERYDVVAIVACGTIIRGVPDRRSDLDIHVLHRGTFRQRFQKFFNGVPCEVFVNPPYRVQRYFDDERTNRRPVFAHMYATGAIVFDPEGIAADVVERAKEALDHPPERQDDLTRTISFYTEATRFEDAEDLLDRDPETAMLLLGQAVFGLVQSRLRAEPAWTPRQKDFLNALRAIDPLAADLAAAASLGDIGARFNAARRLSIHITGSDGFFEWESLPEEV